MSLPPSRLVRAAAVTSFVLGLAGSSAILARVQERPATVALPPVQSAPLADPYDAAQMGIDWLMARMCAWMETTGRQIDCVDMQTKSCFGCHVQSETVLGLARSSSRCYVLPATPCSRPGDESPLQFAARFVADCQRKPCIMGAPEPSCPMTSFSTSTETRDRCEPELGSIGHYPECGSNALPSPPFPVVQSTHGGLCLAGYTDHVAPTYAGHLVALADWWVGRQEPPGNWTPDFEEPPVAQGPVFVAGAAVMALRSARPHADPPRQAAYDLAIARATAWLGAQPLTTTQDKALALMLLLDSGVPAGDPRVVAIVDDILDDQNVDGGWSERAGLESNAYATGQALSVLFEAGVSRDGAEVCAGLAWLLDHQNADGSWSIGVTGISTDSTRNSGFTATIWPIMALGSLNPYGARIDAPVGDTVTCEPRASWTITVTHAGDTACGRWGRPDTFDIVADNGRGDIVTVDPPSATLDPGDSATITVTWQRSGPLPPPGTISRTAVRATSRGAEAADCLVSAETMHAVITPPDVVPGPTGGRLRIARPGSDLLASWSLVPDPVAVYELVNVEWPSRDARTERPTHAVMDARAAHAVAGSADTSLRLAGEGAIGGPGLVFMKLRALSECYRSPGPTCDHACTHPERCDSHCP